MLNKVIFIVFFFFSQGTKAWTIMCGKYFGAPQLGLWTLKNILYIYGNVFRGCYNEVLLCRPNTMNGYLTKQKLHSV